MLPREAVVVLSRSLASRCDAFFLDAPQPDNRIEGARVIRTLVKRVKWTWRSLLIRSGLPAALDRRAFRKAFSPKTTDAAAHVLLVAPGAGNVGDQAMFEAFLERTTDDVRVVVRRDGDVTVPAEHSERVTVVRLPDLIYGSGKRHRADVATLADELGSAASFSIVGADIMDGRYVMRASVNRSVMARAAATAGVPTRILGFSWNGNARPAARRQLVAASRAGAVPMLRDPLSLRRAERDGITRIVPVADIVFSATSIDRSWGERYSRADKPLAIVNVSGLISRDVDQSVEYVEVIEALLAGGHQVLLLPHVSRPDADDAVACAAIQQKVGVDRVLLAPELPTPAQVRGLTEVADVVITGRMHLAIMSLWNSTPAITLATQGKVEGLMELIGAPELCVEPKPGFGRQVVGALDAILPQGSATRVAIQAARPRLEELALANTQGLEPTGDASTVTRIAESANR
jgi:colanic acid/amylovoran biosynthesis protein